MRESKIDRLLKKLEGKDLSMFGVMAESELRFMKENKTVDEKALRFIEGVLNHKRIDYLSKMRKQ